MTRFNAARERLWSPLFDTIVDEKLPERLAFFKSHQNIGTWRTNSEVVAGQLTGDSTALIFSAELAFMAQEINAKSLARINHLLAGTSVQLMLGAKLYGPYATVEAQIPLDDRNPANADHPPTQARYRTSVSGFDDKIEASYRETLNKNYRDRRTDEERAADEAADLALEAFLAGRVRVGDLTPSTPAALSAALERAGFKQTGFVLYLPARMNYAGYAIVPDGFREAYDALTGPKALRLTLNTVITRDVQ